MKAASSFENAIIKRFKYRHKSNARNIIKLRFKHFLKEKC